MVIAIKIDWRFAWAVLYQWIRREPLILNLPRRDLFYGATHDLADCDQDVVDRKPDRMVH